MTKIIDSEKRENFNLLYYKSKTYVATSCTIKDFTDKIPKNDSNVYRFKGAL